MQDIHYYFKNDKIQNIINDKIQNMKYYIINF